MKEDKLMTEGKEELQLIEKLLVAFVVMKSVGVIFFIALGIIVAVELTKISWMLQLCR